MQTTTILTAGLKCGSKVPAAVGELTVAQISYGIVPTETVLDGTATPIEARLSADGRSWVSEWHTGDSRRQCYVERHTADGRVFHGWIDQDSRRLTQAG